MIAALTPGVVLAAIKPDGASIWGSRPGPEIPGTVDTVAKAPGYVNNVTMGPDGTIYFGVGVGLYAQHKQSPSFSDENESCSR